MYNAHFFAQIFEGKIRMHIIHGYNDIMGIIILCMMHMNHGHIIHGKIQYLLPSKLLYLIGLTSLIYKTGD